MRSSAGRAVLAATVALAAVAAMVLGLVRLRVDTTVQSFLPSSDPALTTWISEQKSFGSDPVAVLLTTRAPAALLSGNPLQSEVKMEGQLAGLPDVSVVYGPGSALNEIAISIQNLLVDISGKRDALMASAEAAAKAKGEPAAAQQAAGQAAVASFDLRYGSLLTRGLKIGLPTLANPSFGPGVFLGTGQQARPAFKWLVPDAHHEAVLIRPDPGLNQAQTSELVTRVRRVVAGAGLPLKSFVVTGSPVIAASLGQEVLAEIPLLGSAAVGSVLVCFLVLNRRRRWWRRLLPLGLGLLSTAVVMAAFGWLHRPLSVGVLAFLPIILGVGTDYPIYALAGGRVRLVLGTAAASAAGLAVLVFSPLPFVRDLGAALAAGLVVSAAMGLAAARILPAEANATTTAVVRDGTAGRPGSARRGTALRVGGAVLVLASAAGWVLLGRIGLNSDPERLASGLPALRSAVHAESVLGASGELDVFVRGGDVVSPAMLAWYDAAQRDVLARNPGLQEVVSPVTLLGWLGPHPTASQVAAGLELLPPYLTTASIRDDHRQAIMAFGVKLGSLGSEARVVSDVRGALPAAPPGIHVAVTGLPVVAARSYQLTSSDRYLPSLAGLAAFGIVMLAVAGRRRHALLATLAAATATGWGFLLLYVSGTALTPLTLPLGTLTSAVGGEFTVMALQRVTSGSRRPWAAVALAAATSVIGFLALGLSRLELLRQFGLVLAGSLLLAGAAARLVVAGTARHRDEQIPEAAGTPADEYTRSSSEVMV